jgi:hypothetical protein
MFQDNENNLELKAPKKTDEQKIKEIFDNEKLLEKVKKSIKLERKKLVQHYGDSILLKNDKTLENYLAENKKNIKNEITQCANNLEILQNAHRNFAPTQLNLEFNELFLGEDKNLIKKKKMQKLVPVLENEIKITEIETVKTDPISFSKEKTLPILNDTGDKNAFTINNESLKEMPKRRGFPKEKTIIDSVFNSEFSLIESNPIIDRKPAEIEKEIVYIPFTDNIFKRLRKSRRTKDTYFTIKGEPIEKKNNKLNELSKINENNFLIKNEYIYIETEN